MLDDQHASGLTVIGTVEPAPRPANGPLRDARAPMDGADILPANSGSHLHLPLVSVTIPCFNQEAFIEAAIRSVAAQSYGAFECVVVDDMSTDDSRSRIQACLDEMGDSRFRLLTQSVNRGQMATMMAGLDATDAPLAAFLDGDDVWHPRFLECHVRTHLSPVCTAAMSSSDQLLMDSSGVMLAGSYPNFRLGDPRRSARATGKYKEVEHGAAKLVFVDREVSGWLWSSTSGMMFRRDVLSIIRVPDPDRIRMCADEYLAFAAHMLGGSVRIEQVLGSYRLHPKNGWADGRIIGSNAPLGATRPDTGKAIREALADRWCAIAPGLEHMVPRVAMRRSLVAFIGWQAAFDLSDRNPQAAFLLHDWATPARRLWLRLVRLLPSRLRPKHFRSR
ncbi:glycosyltransferase family 2 protein [Mesorhizobium marinum]|uniref:glycosyltransferase family 2 protein n=1 Tax=Mesorhizobium marinum TaxID=3228790 RepID=UPI00346597A7